MGIQTEFPMTTIHLPQALPKPRGVGQTSRKDRWWVQPLLVFLGFSAFIVYATWAGMQGVNYWVTGTGYLSPMYSPVLFDSWQIRELGLTSGHAWFGAWPDWIPRYMLHPWFVITPAALILWAPGGFRFTCYYYRGAYYKAFWADPLNCAVGEPSPRGKRYRGEAKLPLILHNLHRYFFYVAVVFIGLLTYDAIQSYFFADPSGTGRAFGIGIGSLVLTINPILLGCYTFGCHVARHLVGGRKDRLSELGGAKKAYDCVSCLNRRHMMWAWLSLFWVGFTDFYVRMVASGVWTDFRIL
jgi:hypothetical protein